MYSDEGLAVVDAIVSGHGIADGQCANYGYRGGATINRLAGHAESCLVRSQAAPVEAPNHLGYGEPCRPAFQREGTTSANGVLIKTGSLDGWRC